MLFRTTVFGTNTFARAHVEMLAHDWGTPIPGGSEKPKRHRPRLHVTLRQHHHLPLHAAHH